MLALKWRIQGEDKYFVITICVLPSIQTPLVTVNGNEKGSNKSELVWHSPSQLLGLQTPIPGTTWKPISNQPENQKTDIPY